MEFSFIGELTDKFLIADEFSMLFSYYLNVEEKKAFTFPLHTAVVLAGIPKHKFPYMLLL